MTNNKKTFDTKSLIKNLNKSLGIEGAYNLNENDPISVKEWIPTGSRYLDSIICKGRWGGYPIGRVTEIAGLAATGKSYLACVACKQAQDMGILPVYFDTEASLDRDFIEKLGIDLDNFIYIKARFLEEILESIERLMTETEQRMLFVLDSYPMAAARGEAESKDGFNPNSTVGLKPRILSKSSERLSTVLSDHGSTWIIVNQLKANITSNIWEMKAKPHIALGGATMEYLCSLRIWLKKPFSKKTFIESEKGFRTGSTVRVHLEKSRFGTERRQCEFQISWAGEKLGILDEESWLEAIKPSARYSGGAWRTITTLEGEEIKFRESDFADKCRNDLNFRQIILQMMEEEQVQKFQNQEGDVSHFYGKEEEDEESDKS